MQWNDIRNSLLSPPSSLAAGLTQVTLCIITGHSFILSTFLTISLYLNLSPKIHTDNCEILTFINPEMCQTLLISFYTRTPHLCPHSCFPQ